MRADARRNLERIRAAAAEAFAEHGLDASLDDVARRAGVSAGTIYHRFGGRAGLIDAVVADMAQGKLDAAIAATAGSDPWELFASYIRALGEAQAADPTFNEVVARRYLEAVQVRAVVERAVAHAESLLRAAQAAGSMRADITAVDVERLIWLNAHAVRLGGNWWRRGLGFFLDGMRTART